MSQFSQRVAERRKYQRSHWGEGHDDKHGPWDWTALLARYLGRVADSAMQNGFKADVFEQALVDLAAVAEAAYESERRVTQRPGYLGHNPYCPRGGCDE